MLVILFQLFGMLVLVAVVGGFFYLILGGAAAIATKPFEDEKDRKYNEGLQNWGNSVNRHRINTSAPIIYMILNNTYLPFYVWRQGNNMLIFETKPTREAVLAREDRYFQEGGLDPYCFVIKRIYRVWQQTSERTVLEYSNGDGKYEFRIEDYQTLAALFPEFT